MKILTLLIGLFIAPIQAFSFGGGACGSNLMLGEYRMYRQNRGGPTDRDSGISGTLRS